MIQARYREFLQRITKESGLQENDIDKRIKQKQAALGGLITLEGAALIVASELGIKFDMQKVKVGELMTGMRNIDVLGKVVRVYPVRKYKQRNGEEGKIGSFLVADETGSVRIVLWDTNHISLIEENKIKENDVFLIKKADVRGTDIKELHLGGKSAIERSEDKIEKTKITFALSSSRISDLKENDRTAVRATIVQTFPISFYPSCPECKKRLAESDDKYYCTTHGEIKPKFLPVFGFYIDDGSANIRAVCFFESLKKLLNIEEEQLLALKEDSKSSDELRDSLLGQEFMFEGRTRRNALFNRLEFVINSASNLDIDKITEELSKEVGLS